MRDDRPEKSSGFGRGTRRVIMRNRLKINVIDSLLPLLFTSNFLLFTAFTFFPTIPARPAITYHLLFAYLAIDPLKPVVYIRGRLRAVIAIFIIYWPIMRGRTGITPANAMVIKMQLSTRVETLLLARTLDHFAFCIRFFHKW